MPNFSLTPQLESFVADRVATGDYNNASEVVREALRVLQQRELRLASLDAALSLALGESERGEGQPADEVFERLESKYGAMAKAAKR